MTKILFEAMQKKLLKNEVRKARSNLIPDATFFSKRSALYREISFARK